MPLFSSAVILQYSHFDCLYLSENNSNFWLLKVYTKDKALKVETKHPMVSTFKITIHSRFVLCHANCHTISHE